MKFLIAGLGSIGRRHLRNLREIGDHDITLYRTHRSTLPEEELAGFPVETDLDSALSQRPDAVIVSNPTAYHLDVAIPAAAAGCHLFLEKPVSDSFDRVDLLRAEVDRHELKVLVGYQYRFHPGLRNVGRWLADGAIGSPVSVNAHWGEYLPGWHPWEDYRVGYSARSDLGGGVALTLSHSFDYLRWLLGEIDAVWAFVGSPGDLHLDVEDTGVIGLRFKNGALGSVYLDYHQRPPSHRLEIVGSSGTIRWDSSNGSACVYRAIGEGLAGNGQVSWETQPVLATNEAGKGYERNDIFLAEMQHFLAVLQGIEEPICTLEDGLRSLDLALSALRSAELGSLVYPNS